MISIVAVTETRITEIASEVAECRQCRGVVAAVVIASIAVEDPEVSDHFDLIMFTDSSIPFRERLSRPCIAGVITNFPGLIFRWRILQQRIGSRLRR